MGAKNIDVNPTVDVINQVPQNEILYTKGTPTYESPKGQAIIGDTQDKTEEVKEESDSPFDIISENPYYNEVLQEVIYGMSFYIDSELGHNFNEKEKDNIKLVLMNYMSNKVNNADLGSLDGIENKLKSMLESFTKMDEGNKKDNLDTIFNTIGVDGLKKDLDTKIIEIKKNKKDNDFTSLQKAFTSIPSIDQPEGDVLKAIETNLLNSSTKFNEIQEIATKVKDAAKTLGMGDALEDILNYITKEWPFLGVIISMFMGGIEKSGTNSEKTKKSVESLQKLLKEKEKSPLDKIETNKNYENANKLNSEELKVFYKYLDSKGIDYSEENFWKEFLNGKSEDPKIIELNRVFNLTLKKGESLKKMDLETFIEKLNSFKKIEEIEEKKKRDLANSEVNDEIIILQAEKTNPDTTTERKVVIERTIAKKEAVKILSFEEYLKRGEIMVNSKLESISIVNEGKNIQIGENTYSISLSYWGERFIKITENKGEYTIYAKGRESTISEKISSEQIKIILSDLVGNNNINTEIEAGGYNVDLTIKKV